MSPFDTEHVRALMDMAEQSLAEAIILEENDRWLGTVNRTYYAAFYAVSAHLETKGYGASKHSGIRSLFNKHIIQEAILRPEHGAFYNKAFDMRHESDYNAEAKVSPEQIAEFVQKAQHFVSELNALTLQIIDV